MSANDPKADLDALLRLGCFKVAALDSESVCYFCSRYHDPSQPSAGGVVIKLSMRLMNIIDG